MEEKIKNNNTEKLLRYFFIYGINTSNLSSVDNFYKIRSKKPEILDSFCITGKDDKKYKLFTEKKLLDLSTTIFPSNINFLKELNIKDQNLDINRSLYYNYIKKEKIKLDNNNNEILPKGFFHSFIVKKAGEGHFGDIQWYVNCYIYWERIRTNIIIAKAMIIVTYEPCLSFCYKVLKNLNEKICQYTKNKIDFNYDNFLFEIFNKCEISFRSINTIQIDNFIESHKLPYLSYLPMCDINLFYFFQIFTLEELLFLVQEFLLRQRVLIMSNKIEVLYSIFHIIYLCSHPLEASDSVNFYKLITPCSNLKFSEYFSPSGKGFSLYAYSENLNFNTSDFLFDVGERSKAVNTLIIIQFNEKRIERIMAQQASGQFNQIKIVYKKENNNINNDINQEEINISSVEIEPFLISQLKKLNNYDFNKVYDNINNIINSQKENNNVNSSFYDYDSNLNILSNQILENIFELNSMFLLSFEPYFEYKNIFSQNNFNFKKEIVEKCNTGRISGDFNDLASYCFNDIKNKFNHDSIDHIYITQLINLLNLEKINNWDFSNLKKTEEDNNNECIIHINFPKIETNEKQINNDFCELNSRGEEIKTFKQKKIDNQHPEIINLSNLNNIDAILEKNRNEEKEISPFYSEIINFNIFEKLNFLNLKELNEYLISQALYVFINSYFLINGFIIIEPNKTENNLQLVCDNILKLFENSYQHFKQLNFVLYLIQKLSFTYEYMNTKAKNNFFGKTKEYGYIQPFGVSDLNERYDKEFKNLQKNENKKNILIKKEEDIKQFIYEEGNFTFYNNDDTEIQKDNIIINKESFVLENKENKNEIKVKYNNEDFEIISPSIILLSIMEYFLKKGNADFPEELIQNPKSEIYNNWNRDIKMILFYGLFINNSDQ